MALDGFNANLYEMGEYFAEPPATYHLVLPSKWRMKRLARKNARAARRGPVAVTLELVRPLNEETGYIPVSEMSEEDYVHVLAELKEHFEAKGLTVSNLSLTYLRKITPRGDFQEPYDLVRSAFTVEVQ